MFIVIVAVVVIFALLISYCLLSRDAPHSENTLPSEDIDKVYKVENTLKSCDSENTSTSGNIDKVYRIEIIPEFCYLIPNEEKVFKIKATNLITGEEVSPGLIQWQAIGGAIDDRGKLIVGSQSKGTFDVTATSHDYNLISLVKYTVLPKLKNIEIITTKEIVMPGQAVCLELRGTDQTRSEINIEGQPIWSTTTGAISSHNKLIVDLPNRIVYITAKIGGLEAKTTIRVGELPQKVVNPIHPIDIPSPNPNTTPIPKTTPTQDNISIPIVYNHYPEDEIPKNEPEQIKESSRLVSLEIDAPDLIFLKPSQERVFTVRGINQFGEYIDPGKILWRATGGAIDSQGRLIVENDAKGSFRVTAISSNAKVSQHRLKQNLLLIKISLKIFSWILSHKKFVKDTASYFAQDFFDAEVFVNKIFPAVDTNNIDGILTVLVFDDIKDWVVEAVVNIMIDYLDKFIGLCFVEDFDPLVCSKSYIVLPELESKGILKVTEIVESSSCTLNNNEIQSGLVNQRIKPPLLTQDPPLQTLIREDIYLDKPDYNDIIAELRRIRIVSFHKKINPVDIIQFQLLGTDRNGKDISIKAPIIWKTTNGQINSAGRLIVKNLNNIIQVTATVGQLEIKTDMRSYRRHYTESDTFTEYY